ncbi:MAG: ATP-binding protein [Acidobacteria bacterium]|nr:ATP-binding protein [Acidobacteriota bacterium]
MYKRNIEGLILEAVKETRVLLINGARQTGKTTLVQNLINSGYPAAYVTLDDINALSAAGSDPTGFIKQFTGPVVIDEVQRAPELFLPIKAVVDRNPRPGLFILTGSANVLTLPKLADTLAGRMEIVSLWPLSQGEIEGIEENFIDWVFGRELKIARSAAREDVDREELLRRVLIGGYPQALGRSSERTRRQWFDGYLTTLLERDVRDLSKVRDLKDFPRLLQALGTRSSTLLNLNDVSRLVGIQHETLRRYTALLEAMWLIIEQPAWSTNLGKRLVKTPKITLNDTGLLASLLGINRERLDREPILLGQLLESFVVMELRKQITWSETPVKIYHFRDHKGAEVDIVLETPSGEIVGIEVKATATPGISDLSGLRSLQSLVGKRFRRGVLLHTGASALHHSDEIYFLPIPFLWRRQTLSRG